MTFSENLLALRQAKHLKQSDVAEAVEIGTRAYQRYEYGEREPQLSVLIKLARFYDISIDELVCYEKKRDQPSL